MLQSFFGLTREALTQSLTQWNWDQATERDRRKYGDDLGKRLGKRSALQARQVFQWVYGRGVTNWDEMTDVSKSLREWASQTYSLERLTLHHEGVSEDGTLKFLWRLHDGKTIESVIIPSVEDDGTVGRRLTGCISSQVGCAMACRFCLTGVQGLDRQLETHEIVRQVFELRQRVSLTNVVFMGMGEPLHNVDNVIDACKILLDENGFDFSKRKVTVSTSGLVPAIEKLGREVDVSLAISLNGSNDEQRESVMPINKKWPIKELLRACREYPVGSHRKVTYEYVLMAGVNDDLDSAQRVFELLRHMPAKVNLIPFNEHPASPYKRPTDGVVKAFQNHLVQRGMTATVRTSRGRDILAACGQLRSQFGTARGTDRHQDSGYQPSSA